MFLARLGPMFAKHSKNRFAMSLGLLISWLSNLKAEGRLPLLIFRFISSFRILQVFFIFNLHPILTNKTCLIKLGLTNENVELAFTQDAGKLLFVPRSVLNLKRI